ncbi:MAG: hypothetical protein HY701_06745 [Gemmatimonadetes bacterium]|nr:hypothetical protein [Gemmatimonadota bacterium]
MGRNHNHRSADAKGNGTPEPSAPEQPPDATPELAPDATLGGYFKTHTRPPAFEGSDAQPYTVSIEVEKTGDLVAPYVAYLVFPRWASTGIGIVGHVESEIIGRAKTREQAQERAEALTLYETKRLLDEAIQRKARELEGP